MSGVPAAIVSPWAGRADLSLAQRVSVGVVRGSAAPFRSTAEVAGSQPRSVGVAGFEPTAPRSQSECATKLRHTPGAN
jgi:hypothetical protein